MIFQNTTPQNNNPGFFRKFLGNGAATSNAQTPPPQPIGTALSILSLAPVPAPEQHEPTDPKQFLQQKLGARTTQLAERVGAITPGLLVNQGVNAITGSSNGIIARAARFVGNNVANNIVDFEMVTLQLADQASTITERTSLQDLGQTLHTLTGFITTYQIAFTAISTQTFATKEAEATAWVTAMGDQWLSIFPATAQTPEAKQQAINAYIEATLNRVKTVILSNHTLVLKDYPWVQDFILGKAINFATQSLDERSEQYRGFLHALSDRPRTFRTVRYQMSEFITRQRASLYDIPTPTLTNIPANHLLVETIGTRQVVFYSSDPTLIGMESQTARDIWNQSIGLGQARAGQPTAVIVTDSNGFGGRQPVRALIKTAVLSLLTGAPGAARNRACQRLSQIRFVGRPLAMLVKAIYWVTSLFVKGTLKVGNFFVGLPSADALAEEITRNLLTHLYNPAIMSLPLLMANRLLSILEGNGTNPNLNSTTSDREAFLGEPIVAILHLFTTICPSLFAPYNYPRFVGACVGATLWVTRKTFSASILTVVNPVTRKIAYYAIKWFSRPENKERNLILSTKFLAWVQGSAITVWRTSEDEEISQAVQMSHAILSDGYAKLGEIGLISSEQTHFTRGNRSFAHLIHHTILAGSRMLYANKTSPYIHVRQQIFDQMNQKIYRSGLLAKMDRNETLTEEELAPIKTGIDAKRDLLRDERTAINARIALTEAIPPLDINIAEWFQNKIPFDNQLAAIMTAWGTIEANILEVVQRQDETTGEADLELVLFLRKIAALKQNLDELISQHTNTLSQYEFDESVQKETWIRLYSDIGLFTHKHRQMKFELLTVFQKQSIDQGIKISEYALKSFSITTPAIARECINELLIDNEISTFAHARLAEEQRLRTELAAADVHLQQIMTEWDASVQEKIDNPLTSQHFQARKAEFQAAHQAGINAIPENGLLTSAYKWAVEKIIKTKPPVLSAIEEMDFYTPGVFVDNHRAYAEALAQKITIKDRLAKLPNRPLWNDPVWLLERTGVELVDHAKQTLEVAPMIVMIDEFLQPPAV